MPYADSPLNPGYNSFKSTNSARATTLYVGANDGMMHAFNASTGVERFAYIPSALFTTNTDSSGNPAGLASLTTSPLIHHYMVDGTPTVIDVDFGRTNLATNSASWPTATADWRTVLISGLGKGGGSPCAASSCGTSYAVGGGYFALDVTTPTTNTEANASSWVLWEIDQSSSGFAHLGYSYETPLMIKTKKYGWTLVLTSGYGNDDGQGYFYLVNPKTGALYESVSTGAGSTTSPAGLTYVTAYINDQSDFTADALYAGDLLGNVWRVDLTNLTGSGATATNIATLTSPDGTKLNGSTAQPVTTRPVVGTDPETGNRYLFLGTGQLLNDTDLVNPQTETFYAFLDGNNSSFDTTSTFPITRSNLSSDDPSTGVGTSLPSGKRGFYIDLAAATTNGPAYAGVCRSDERTAGRRSGRGRFRGEPAGSGRLHQGQFACVRSQLRHERRAAGPDPADQRGRQRRHVEQLPHRIGNQRDAGQQFAKQ